MTVSAGVAVAIRANTHPGSNLLLLTNGLSVPTATAAVNETHRMIRSISADAVVEGRSVSTAGALEYITDDDLRVVYHRVNALYVMVVTPASHNAFAAAAYLQHAVSLVIACCKTAEATAEKLAPRYAELYTALYSLVHRPAPSLSTSAAASFSTVKKPAGLGEGTSEHAATKLPSRTTAKFEVPKGVLPQPTLVVRGAPPPPAEPSLPPLFPSGVPLVSTGTTPPISPRRCDATPQLEATPAASTTPVDDHGDDDDPFAEANAMAAAEDDKPALPYAASDPFGVLETNAPRSPTVNAQDDPFLIMGHGFDNAYRADDPFSDAVDELAASRDGGGNLTPASSILPGTPEDLETPETWESIPGWGGAGGATMTVSDPSVNGDDVDMFSSPTPTRPTPTSLPMPLPLTPSTSAHAFAPAGTAAAEAALWVREAAALTVARGVATAIEVEGEVALTADRPGDGVLPACTFAVRGLDDLAAFELRISQAHARYEEAKQEVHASLSPQPEQSCIVAKYRAQTENTDGFPLQVRAVCCQLGKGVFALALMYSFVDNTDPASYRDMEFLVDTCVHECRPSKVHPAAEWVSYADGAARLRWRVPTLLNQGRPVRFRAVFHAKQLPNSGIWAPTVQVKCSRQAVCRTGELGTAALFSGVRLVRVSA